MATKKTPKKTTTPKIVKRVTASKKTVRKTPIKKLIKKTVGKKKQPEKALVCAAEGDCFWTTDGKILANLEDLAAAFAIMDDEVFLYHANKQKNDFADWTESVLSDADCAASLRRSRKPRSAKTVVIRHLKNYF